jgi:C4-type Zn-finger protein
MKDRLPVADKRLPTCPVCGYRATLQYARELYDLALIVTPARHKIIGLVVRCEECSTGSSAVVIPYWFFAEELAA